MCDFHPQSGRKETDCKDCRCPDSILKHRPDRNGVCSRCGDRIL